MRSGMTSGSGAGRNRHRRSAARRLQARQSLRRRAALEALEARSLMAVLPPAIVGDRTGISNQAGDETQPDIAINPVNSQEMVAVWIRSDTENVFPDPPVGPGLPNVWIEAAVSIDGGATWNTFASGPNSALTFPQIDHTTPPDNRLRFTQITDPSVAYDRNGNFYILALHHNDAGDAGVLVLSKFRVTNGVVTTAPGWGATQHALQTWVPNSDWVMHPTLAVDSSLPQLIDVDDQGVTYVQENPFSGNVYIAWASNDTAPAFLAGDPDFNPNRIKLISSSDGGLTFGGYRVINDPSNFGDQRNARPRLAISQGTPEQLRTFSATSDLPLAIPDDGTAVQALLPIAGLPVLPTAAVNNQVLTDVEVTLTILHPDPSQLELTLVGPNGVRVRLARGQGGGSDFRDTTFDSQAATSIADATAPFTGRFRPLQSLDVFDGLSTSVANGTWRLEVQDSVGGLSGTIQSWSLALRTTDSSRHIPGGQVTVVWDDFGTLATASPPMDILWADAVSAGRTVTVPGTTGPILDAKVDTRPDFKASIQATSTESRGVAADDFNGDGRNDVVVTDRQAGRIGVLINAGGDLFDPVRYFPAGIRPTAVVTGDLDNDTKVDIVVANEAGSISILFGQGNGTFGSPITLGAGLGTVDVAVGDLNGDSKLDIVALNQASASLTIHFNTSTAQTPRTFVLAGEVSTGLTSPRALAVANLGGGSALPDIAVANNQAGPDTVTVIENATATNGTLFAAGPVQQFGVGPDPVDLVAADIDRDGINDLVTANGGGKSLSVLRNTSTGAAISFAGAVPLGVGATPTALAVGAFENAAVPQVGDLAVTTANDQVVVLINRSGPGAVQFDAPLAFAIDDDPTDNKDAAGPVAIASSPLGGTAAQQDLVVANAATRNVSILFSQARPSIGFPTVFTADVNVPAGFVANDLDVRIAFVHPNLAELLIELVAPNGQRITLQQNQLDAAGATISQFIGNTGADMGVLNGLSVGTIFNDQASRNIVDIAPGGGRGVGAPFIGHFQPELGSLNGLLASLGPQGINGQWRLEITDVRVTTGQISFLNDFRLQFNSGGETGDDSIIATTFVRGTTDSVFPRATNATPNGIGPGLVVAQDNTLGAFSPFQGRIYASYVERYNTADNPADNTEVMLVHSDDGGRTWSAPVQVNDDLGVLDGYSEASFRSGRPQWQPSIAVDNTTGTVVIGWLDTRYDSARGRYATMITTSIDGGETFADEVFLNFAKTAVDAITGQEVVLGPIPENQAAGNPVRETAFGLSLGDRQGLAVSDGLVHMVWPGNVISPQVGAGGADLAQPQRMNIRTATARIAAGPRIVDSTMGPVGGPGDLINVRREPDGTPIFDGFEIVFDRPIDPSTLRAEDIDVFYRDTTVENVSGERVPVLRVEPVPTPPAAFGDQVTAGAPLDPRFPDQAYNPGNRYGYTRFRIFVGHREPDGTISGGRSGVGTYSYRINPNAARDRIRHTTLQPVQTITRGAAADQVNLRVPGQFTGGTGTALDVVRSTITVGGLSADEVVAGVQVNLTIQHTDVTDLNITLVAPDGTRVPLAQRVGFGQTANFLNTTFDDVAATPIGAGRAPFTGAFRPASPLSVLRGHAAAGNWALEIQDAAVGDTGTLVSWTLVLQTGRAGGAIVPGNLMDQDADARAGELAIDQIGPGDVYAAPRPSGSGGGFRVDTDRPFEGPYDPSTLPIVLPGPHLVDTRVAGLGTIRSEYIAPPDQVNLILPSVPGNSNGAYNFADVTNSQIVVRDVPRNLTIHDLDVNVSLTHGRLGDLMLVLVAPDGTPIPLATRRGGTADSGYLNTTFDDTATLRIDDPAAAPPYIGDFRPEVPLAQLAGRDPNGTWTLRIIDAADDAATGRLLGWSLKFTLDSPDNLAADRPVSALDLTFDRDMRAQSITTGDVLRIVGPLGSVLSPRDFPATLADPLTGLPVTTLPLRDATAAGPGVLNSRLFIDDNGTFRVGDIDLGIDLAHPDLSHLKIELIAPDGTAAVLADGLSGANLTSTVFDDESFRPLSDGAAPYGGTFRPREALTVFDGKPLAGTWTLRITDSVQGGTGTLLGWTLRATPRAIVTAAYEAPQSNQPIPDGGVLVSPLSVPDDGGAFRIDDLNVRLNVRHPRIPDLTVTLIYRPGTADQVRIPLVVQVGGAANQDFVDTVLDDNATLPIAQGIAPYSGAFKPASPLSALVGKELRGEWALEIVDGSPGAGTAGLLQGWSIEAVPQADSPATARTFRVAFPTQAQSGQYTVTLGADIESGRSDRPDADLNAGVDALLGRVPASIGITPGTIAPYDFHTQGSVEDRAIPANGVVTSNLHVNAALGLRIADLNVGLNLTHGNLADLTIQLIGPDGTTINLASGLAGAALSGTVLDDEAGAALAGGVAPYTGTFRPVQALSAFDGKLAGGTWQLRITNAGATEGVLGAWTLSLTPQPAVGNADLTYSPNTPNQVLADAGTSESTITITGADELRIADLSVGLELDHAALGTLSAVLIAPDGTQVPLFSGLSGANLSGTVLDDEAALGIVAGAAPYFGSFRPTGLLSALDGKPLNGTWRLRVTDGAADGNLALLRTWSLRITPELPAVVAITSDDGAAIPDAKRQTVQSGRLDAGVLLSTIFADVDDFRIADLNVHVDLSHNRLRDLTLELIAPDGTVIALAEAPFGRDLRDTTFDDSAARPITDGAAPYSGRFRPVRPLTNLIGKSLRGIWTLRITDSVQGEVGRLHSWSLSAAPQASYLTYPSGDVPKPLADQGTTVSELAVTDTLTIAAVTVTLDITHGSVPDLTATLIAPDGTRVRLFGGVGRTGTRANFSNTTFDDRAETLIQDGEPPYLAGRYKPETPLSVLNGKNARGTWRLEVVDGTGGNAGLLNSWRITFQEVVTGSGLGDPAADRMEASFRVFTMDKQKTQSGSSWTPVGPAGINPGPQVVNSFSGVVSVGTQVTNGYSGRISAIAVDPSDASGNTVYIGAASGGIWRTNNFLTTDPAGPTWVPLTDLAPTFAMNIGSIAVFPRNGDPNQSIIIAATGDPNSFYGYGSTNNPAQEGNTSRGVGFIRSTDGGATWTLLDSTDNRPGAIRDRAFVNQVGFKVIVDPTPNAANEAVIYAALSGTNGGLWRSIDSGTTWEKVSVDSVHGTNATDVLFDYNSRSATTGNLDILYVAFQDVGVFMSPNRGGQLNLMAGTSGKPLFRAADIVNEPAIAVNNTPSPNGIAGGRIVLAKPDLVPESDPAATTKNLLYQGWLYAAVATDAGLAGLFLTKDYGATWTELSLLNNPFRGANTTTPSNDNTQVQYDPTAGPVSARYNLALTVDPTNPNIVYLGGNSTNRESGLLRVDATGLRDAHTLLPYDDTRNDTGLLSVATAGAVVVIDPVNLPSPSVVGDPTARYYLNLLHDPNRPFDIDASLRIRNVSAFVNDGTGVKWTPFDFEALLARPTDNTASTNLHHAISLRDPLTGRARLIFANDQGVFSVVDRDGQVDPGIGNAIAPAYSRNGNLQIAQLYQGATQPTSLAADIAGALIYGAAQGVGHPASSPDLLQTGFIQYTAYDRATFGLTAQNGGEHDSSGVATDATGSGTVYQFKWPFFGDRATITDFFQVNGDSRTSGLVQDPSGFDPQWPVIPPVYRGGIPLGRFAVNPLNGNQIIISSNAGRIFGTTNQGRSWHVIGDPGALDGTYAPALAYGAPDPGAPGGAGNQNNFLYAGTIGGNIFMTRNGGGVAGNQWVNISAGLDGSPVVAIVPSPVRGSHEAFAATLDGVYYMADSTAAGATWVNITGNLFSIPHDGFGDPALSAQKLEYLTALAVDWRYRVPQNPDLPAGPNNPVRPLLYAAGQGGVYRSVGGSNVWSLFPNTAEGAIVDGAGLPNVHVSDLDLSLGRINPTTGTLIVDQSAPTMLLASTFGRGAYAIRVGPVVFPDLVALDSKSDTGVSDTDLITSDTRPIFNGLSLPTANGNTTTVQLIDLSDPTRPAVIGTGQTDVNGHFTIQVVDGYFRADGSTDGLKTIGVQATDSSGTVGNIARLQFVLDTARPAQPDRPDLDAASDTFHAATPDCPIQLGSDSDNLTSTNVGPVFRVYSNEPPTTVVVLLRGGVEVARGSIASLNRDPIDGAILIADPGPVTPDGKYSYQVQLIDLVNNRSDVSAALEVTFDTLAPAAPPTPRLDPRDDTGAIGDGVTSVGRPRLTGTAEPGSLVELIDSLGNTLGCTTADALGAYTVQPDDVLADGTYTLRVRATDAAGNTGLGSTSTATTIVVQRINPVVPTIALRSEDDSGTKGDSRTNVRQPRFFGTAGPGQSLTLLANGVAVGSTTVSQTGTYQVQPSSPLAAGHYEFMVRAIDGSGNIAESETLELEIILSTPAQPTLVMSPQHDTGRPGDNLTTVRRPLFTGTVPGGDRLVVELFDGATGRLLRSTTTDAQGRFSAQIPGDLVNGQLALQARAVDDVGNVSTPSDPLIVRVYTTADDYDNDARSDAAVYAPAAGTWTIVPAGGGATRSVALGQAGDIPITVDIDGDGKADVALYRPSTSQFLIQQSTAGFILVDFGNPNDQPVPADYDGDFRTDLATFTAATGTWSIVGLAEAPDPLGQAGDIGVPGDYDGDFKADLAVYRPSTGQFLIRRSSDGTTVTVTVGTGGDAPVPGDYDSDGRIDPATYRPATGEWLVLLSSTGNVQTISFGNAATDVPVPDDYDGDQKTDIAVYRPATGQYLIRRADGTADVIATGAGNRIPVQSPYIYRQSAGAQITTGGGNTGGGGGGGGGGGTLTATANDFNGDGRSDAATFRPGTGGWSILPSGAGRRAVRLGRSGDIPVSGDFDGDLVADLAVYRPSTGQFLLQRSSAGAATIKVGNPKTDLPATGDFDGDGVTDLAVFRPGTGAWIIRASTAGRLVYRLGRAGDVPVPADYNGDGKAEPAIYRPSTGTWQALGSKAVRLGGSAYVPVPADFDGDGKVDMAVYRPGSARWLIRQSSNLRTRSYVFGARRTDVPVPDDFDGDGKADLAVYRPGTGRYLVRMGGGVRTSSFAPGGTRAVPVQAPLAYRLSGGSSMDLAAAQKAARKAAARKSSATDLGRTASALAMNRTVHEAVASSKAPDLATARRNLDRLRRSR